MVANCKICLVGEMAVGKTSLANRYVSGSQCCTYRPNINAYHFSTTKKTSDGTQSMFIWDTAGTERFRSMTPIYLRGSTCCLLTFSLTDKKSFSEVVSYWEPFVREWAPTTRCVLVANKVDAVAEREVTVEEINKFCNGERIKYFETSAVTGHNVNEVFGYAGKVANKRMEMDSFMDSFKLYETPNPVKNQKWCCV